MCIWKNVHVLLLLLQICQRVDGEVIYITPSLNAPCPQRSCFSLTEYINNPDPGFNITLMLLSGNHGLEIPFSVMNKGRFLMIASSNTDAPHVTCTGIGNLSLSSIQQVTIRGISFIDCRHNIANSIINFTMQDTSFINSTTIDNGAVWSLSSSTTVVLENCTFASNIIQRGGTLNINMVSKLMIFMCAFIKNEVKQEFRDGGALFITETNSIISQSMFLSNQVRGEGGAIYISGGNITINESVFISNQVNGSSSDGGALYIKNANSIVTKSTFTNNRVNRAGEGGAVYISGGSVTICKSNFTHNQAGVGGALYIRTANSTVIKSIFTSNQGNENSDMGGAIYISGGYSTIGESTFMSNQVKGRNGQGGAIRIWKAINLMINNSMFMQNQANGSGGDGGAVSIWDTNSIITESIFIKNQVRGHGGAIYIYSLSSQTRSAIVISASKFTENYINSRDGNGGAVYIYRMKLTIQNCMFTSNRVDGSSSDGGAMYIRDANSTIDNVTFVNNQVSGSSGAGGAVYYLVQFPSSSVFLKQCEFINNKAGQRERAGAVHVYAGSFRYEGRLSVSHCQFSDNSGEAIYTYNVSKLLITSSTFVNHSNGRASLFAESPIRRNSYGEVLVNQSSFVGNIGAIEIINIRRIEMHSSNLSRNTVYSRKGGAISATGKDVDVLLSHSTFSKNTAASCGAVSISTLHARIYSISNTFSNNIATGQHIYSGGGVACFSSASVIVNDTMFNDNLANFDGGVFRMNESFVTIKNSIFTGNSASNHGGIGHLVNCSLVVKESTFINNSALNGGVFAIKSGLTAIDKNSFYNNRADGEGGVLYFSSNPGDIVFVKIEDNRFLENKAVIGGRILHAQNYTIDDLLQTGCICYCSTAYVISRTFAATRNSNNCTVCSLLNERFYDIATCSADVDVTSTSKPRKTTIAASSGSVIAVILIAMLAVVATIMIGKRFKTKQSPG